jgi:hypothetical protein
MLSVHQLFNNCRTNAGFLCELRHEDDYSVKFGGIWEEDVSSKILLWHLTGVVSHIDLVPVMCSPD